MDLWLVMYLHGQNFELNSMVAVCEQYEVISSFQQSFLINYHHNCHFRPKTRNYVQTEISEPLVYRLYVQCAITFYLFNMCEPMISEPGYIFGVKSHFIWHVWDVQTNYFWPRAVSYTPPHILIKSWYSWWTPDKIQIDSMTSMWTPDGLYQSQDFVDYFLQGCKAVSSLQ